MQIAAVHDVTRFRQSTCTTVERLRVSGCAAMINNEPAVTADFCPPKSLKLSPISVSRTSRLMRCCERSCGFFPRCERYSGADDRALCSHSQRSPILCDDRVSITEPIENHLSPKIRGRPIFPELRLILDEAFEIFGDKCEYVVAAPRYRAAADAARG